MAIRSFNGKSYYYSSGYRLKKTSWLKAIEGFFAKLTRRRLQRGVFRPVHDLHITINRFVAETNDNPKPFGWTADPNRIIAAVNPWKHVIESVD